MGKQACRKRGRLDAKRSHNAELAAGYVDRKSLSAPPLEDARSGLSSETTRITSQSSSHPHSLSMARSELGTAQSKRQRERYSRLICLRCRERRIRCELPSEVEVPSPGELRTVETPCYRCNRLGVSCVVRQTILGRPSLERKPADPVSGRTTNDVSRICIELDTEWATDELQMVDRLQVSTASGGGACWKENTLLFHIPQSSESVIIIRALDTLRRERVEEEWFRHLPAYVGHTRALDLSIKAIVAACAFARGESRITSGDCYQALALALSAVQARIKESSDKPNDDILASTALLAPFEGVIKKNGIPTTLHVEGLAAILAARPAAYPITQLARDILDFNAGEAAIMACIQGTSSPFESLDRTYFCNNRVGYSNSDQVRLKALGNELFVHLPRVVKIVRMMRRRQSSHVKVLPHALGLSASLVGLQDPQAEHSLLQTTKIRAGSPDVAEPLGQSLDFPSIQDFEALAYYWQARLSLLRLQYRLWNISVASRARGNSADKPGTDSMLRFESVAAEMLRLTKRIIMCSDFARTLPLNKHVRMFAHAMVVVWGAIQDLKHVQGSEDMSAMSNFVLQKTSAALAAKPDFAEEDMDLAAGICVGGEPKGRFAELFGLRPTMACESFNSNKRI